MMLYIPQALHSHMTQGRWRMHVFQYFFCIYLIWFPVSCYYFNMPRKQLESMISLLLYLGLRYQSVFTWRLPLIKQGSLLHVYSYKAVLLSVLQHIIVYQLWNYYIIATDSMCASGVPGTLTINQFFFFSEQSITVPSTYTQYKWPLCFKAYVVMYLC